MEVRLCDPGSDEGDFLKPSEVDAFLFSGGESQLISNKFVQRVNDVIEEHSKELLDARALVRLFVCFSLVGAMGCRRSSGQLHLVCGWFLPVGVVLSVTALGSLCCGSECVSHASVAARSPSACLCTEIQRIDTKLKDLGAFLFVGWPSAVSPDGARAVGDLRAAEFLLGQLDDMK